ncbi:receptor-like protein kinase, partial [Trifolium pratense]
MGTMHNLFYGLNLSANGLIGDIPSEIGKLELLQSLDISLNNLSGSIDALEDLVSLVEVNISFNHLDGSVPTGLMKLLNSSPSSFMVLMLIILRYLHRNETKRASYPKQQSPTEMKLPDLHDRVLEATDNLNGQYIIGRGAHGIVYKAIVYRRVCAVKKIEFGWNKQKWLSIMHNEIKVLRMLRHRNLIKYCNHWIGNDYGLVIYKFIENGSLYNILHVKKPPPPLTWNVRFNIAVGIAQGLAYLHYDCVPPILHRDIKPKNILVNDNMEPVIADFGTALCKKLFEDSNSYSETRKMLSSHVVGTPGYIAPGCDDEFIFQHSLEVELCKIVFSNMFALSSTTENAYDIVPGRMSDVYSYGVVLLEIITRKKLLVPSTNNEAKETHIVTWVRSVILETGKIENIVDPYLTSAFPNSVALAKQVNAVTSLALQCTEKDPRRRPTMKDVIAFFNMNLFKLRCDEVDYRDGLSIKPIGNGKIQSEKVIGVANLVVPKITYAWPSLIFLPSITGPILTK